MVSRPLRFTYILLGLDVGPELDQRPQSGRLADLGRDDHARLSLLKDDNRSSKRSDEGHEWGAGIVGHRPTNSGEHPTNGSPMTVTPPHTPAL